jgi:hypothetical protein
VKKKIIQRRVGHDGKYPGLLTKEKRTWSSADSNVEKTLRDFSDAPRPTVAETIDQYESHALAIIEAEGYEVKKPYRFGDSYDHDKGWATLSGLIEMQIGTDEGSLEPLGRAAQILTDCHQLRQSMESGTVENTAHHAMLLQQSVDYLNFMQWEYSALVGEAQLFPKHVVYTAADRASWVARFNELRKENPKIKKRPAARIIQSETGHDSETIRKFI